MEDDHIKADISAYLAGGLTEARNRELESHLAVCEKCHQAMNKARAKQAHQNREALKKAASDRMPNLFLARQGKETGVDRRGSRTPWIVAGILLISGGLYAIFFHFNGKSQAPFAAPLDENPVVSSTSTASAEAVPADEAPAPAPVVRNTPPITLSGMQEWKGADSGVKTARLVVVRHEEAWQKLWSEMGSADPLPPVKFGQFVVIGVFVGEQATSTTISFGRVRETETDVAVPYEVQRSTIVVIPPPIPIYPYLLSTMPRTEKKIRLTQWEVP